MRRFMTDRSGASALETAIIAACLALALVATAQALGPKLAEAFDTIASAMAGDEGGGTEHPRGRP